MKKKQQQGKQERTKKSTTSGRGKKNLEKITKGTRKGEDERVRQIGHIKETIGKLRITKIQRNSETIKDISKYIKGDILKL